MTINNLPGDRDNRASRALYLAYVEGKTQQEIADSLGVTQPAVSKYINEPPGDELKEELEKQALDIRRISEIILRGQLQAAQERAIGAETLSEDWGDGDIRTARITDEDGKLIERKPIPEGFEMDDDHDARADARSEVRDILEGLQAVTGMRGKTIEITTDDDSTGMVIETSVYNDGDREDS